MKTQQQRYRPRERRAGNNPATPVSDRQSKVVLATPQPGRYGSHTGQCSENSDDGPPGKSSISQPTEHPMGNHGHQEHQRQGQCPLSSPNEATHCRAALYGVRSQWRIARPRTLEVGRGGCYWQSSASASPWRQRQQRWQRGQSEDTSSPSSAELGL